ncbi:MAG: homoserine dehydrogenase, partial [Oscillospiraceae bacterium]|nr:homoserine dehydrogenase [Oscillospiraceae bacterium]
MAKIAVLGYGVVGSGTVEVFYKNKESLEKKAGQELDIKYILDLRDFPDSPYQDKFVKDFDTILNDDEVTVVAEVIGGLKPAADFVKSALEAGKSVVTSNKEMVAARGAELLETAKRNNVNFFFEASVGGGIPIIKPLHACLSANEIDEIAGILNGTTNFILTKMIRDGMGFDEALKIAQELGYAERNPSADVDGHDACRKICILASLAFGKHVYPDSVHTEGITKITLEDVEYCDSYDAKIKLIGCAKREEDDKISIGVFPAIIKNESQLAGVNDVFNAILVRGDATGDVVFYGKGAGKLPTASAVVSDIISAVKHSDTSRSLTWRDSEQDFIRGFDRFRCAHYIRLRANNAEVTKAVIKALFGEVEYLSSKKQPDNELAFVTGVMSEQEARTACEKAADGAEILGRIR